MTAAFDFLNSITTNNDYLMLSDEDEQNYAPFFINRGLSQYIDCIMYANEINMNSHLANRLQYDYLFHSIRKMHRKVGKWAKRKDDAVIKSISAYYDVNFTKAKAYAEILTDEQKTYIKKLMDRVAEK